MAIPTEKLEVAKASALETSAGAHPAILVEFRGQQSDKIKWTDKQTGKAREMEKIAVAAEFLTNGAQVTLEVLSGRGEEALKPLPYTRGDIMLVELSAFSDTREGKRARVASHQLYRGKA